MSAITETEPGREMVCILSFEVRPRNVEGQPDLGPYRGFSVGEYVKYISHFFVEKPKDNPIGYMAVIEPLDPNDSNKYEATQDYFVSLECWEELKEYFASNLVVMESGKQKTGKKHSYKLMNTKDIPRRKSSNEGREI